MFSEAANLNMANSSMCIAFSNLDRIYKHYNEDLIKSYKVSLHYIEKIERLKMDLGSAPADLFSLQRLLMQLENLVCRQTTSLAMTSLLLDNTKKNIFHEQFLSLVRPQMVHLNIPSDVITIPPELLKSSENLPAKDLLSQVVQATKVDIE